MTDKNSFFSFLGESRTNQFIPFFIIPSLQSLFSSFQILFTPCLKNSSTKIRNRPTVALFILFKIAFQPHFVSSGRRPNHSIAYLVSQQFLTINLLGQSFQRNLYVSFIICPSIGICICLFFAYCRTQLRLKNFLTEPFHIHIGQNILA